MYTTPTFSHHTYVGVERTELSYGPSLKPALAETYLGFGKSQQ